MTAPQANLINLLVASREAARRLIGMDEYANRQLRAHILAMEAQILAVEDMCQRYTAN